MNTVLLTVLLILAGPLFQLHVFDDHIVFDDRIVFDGAVSGVFC